MLPPQFDALVDPTAPFFGIAVQTAGSFWSSYFTNWFVLLIWLLFIASFYLSLRYMKRLSKERAALSQIQENVQQINTSKESDIEIVQNVLLRDVPADSIIAQRVEALVGLAQRATDFESTAFAETLAAQESSRTSFPRSIASILVLLGLCGAIYGLSNLVRQMGPELRNMQELSRRSSAAQTNTSQSTPSQTTSLDSIQQSVNTLIETMAGSLEHTRGAFAASLTGIAGSILLLLLNGFVGGRQIAFLTDVETLTSTKLIPLFKPRPPVLALSGAVDSFRLGAEHAAGLAARLDDLFQRATESLSMVFAIVRKFEEGAAFIGQNHQGMTDTQGRMLALAEQLMGLTRQIEEHQAGSKEDIYSIVGPLKSNNDYIKQALDEWRKKHEQLLQQVESVAKQASFSSNDAKKETQNLLASDINNFRATVLDAFEKLQKLNNAQLLQMLKDQKQYVDDLQKAVLDGQGHKELVEGVSKLLAEERAVLTVEFREMMKSQHEQFARILSQYEMPMATPQPAKRAGARQEIGTLSAEMPDSLSNHATHIIAVLIVLVSGAGSVALATILVILAKMIGWFDSLEYQGLVLVAVLLLCILCFRLISSMLIRAGDHPPKAIRNETTSVRQ